MKSRSITTDGRGIKPKSKDCTVTIAQNTQWGVCVHACGSDAHTSHTLSASVCLVILRGSRQSTSQPEHDLESETTCQGTKCVTWAQSSSCFLKRDTETEKERESVWVWRRESEDGGRGEKAQKLIKSFEIATEGTCMQSSQGEGLMRLCLAAG